MINRINRRIDSLMEVSTGLLDIYQWQSQRPDTKRALLSLKGQIERLVDLFKANAQEKGLSIDVAFPDKDLLLMGTEEEMEKILNNLITNAIKYTPSGGSIFIELSDSEGDAILRVKDTGIGIAAEDMPKIFDPYVRTKEAKEMDPFGRGLGLPFVKKVVETLGGTIRVESDEGKGTEFILVFPQK